ncbi:MAG TPA: rod shape-determining protein MreD [Flavobacteriales bacterium]|nr:rod shape-determining protein MreD [Flavobacteriales bacterium]
MVNILVNNCIRFLVLVLLQVLVLNEIQLGVYMNVYLYVLFILLLPFETPGWLILPLCFSLGFCIDISLNTLGLHTSAATFAAFVRPVVLRLLKPREGYDINASPALFTMGFNWFVSYALILVFLHHTWLFFIEAFRFSDIIFIFMKIFASLFLNVFLILLAQILTASSRNR